MSNRHSPLKRRHSEYHDPDYPQEEDQAVGDDGESGCSKKFPPKRKRSGDEIKKTEIQNEDYYHKVRQVIEKEFQKEILMKQKQLEEIDKRLEKAKHLLNRLRYCIVSEYYKKQEIPLTAADVAILRGPNCLFERENKGPQMPLHPSLKKLIGKRPKDLSEVIRSCPKRTAAQNAVQTIRARSESQKREERKLKQIIRYQGIVIDHSKQSSSNNNVTNLLNAYAQNSIESSKSLTTHKIKQEKTSNETFNNTSGQALNAARLNNKTKHLIVVGNTSKYIGNEVERDLKTQSQNLTHKWLVYVQSKETKQPIEHFVKKVRFYMHHSYRPNDVVDVNSPPFQVSRRGWGEFPIRVQLFFHSEYHQKPIQLVHDIILDQTLTGIESLGAETLLEIWLRDVKPVNSPHKEEKEEVKVVKNYETPTKFKNNLLSRADELVDDNLLEFLNKIEASPCSLSADIEKIQPTVVVTEPLSVKLKTPSPVKAITTPMSIPSNTVVVTEPFSVKLRTPSPVKAVTTPMVTPPNTVVETEPLSVKLRTSSPVKAVTTPMVIPSNTVVVTEPVKLRTPSPVKAITTPIVIPSNTVVVTEPQSNVDVVTEPLSVKLRTPSPVKTITTPMVVQSNPEKSFNLTSNVTTSTNTTISTLCVTKSITPKAILYANNSLILKPMTTTSVTLPTNAAQNTPVNSSISITNSVSYTASPQSITSGPIVTSLPINQFQSHPSMIQKQPIILSKDDKMLTPSTSVASAVHRTVLPIINNMPTNITVSTFQTSQLNTDVSIATKPHSVTSSEILTSSVPKQILQKKLVQLIDSSGKVKYIQMLVAASSTSVNVQNLRTTSMAPKLITMSPSSLKNSLVTNTMQTMNTTTSINGAYLTPTKITKPNIFKIVPESMQIQSQTLTPNTTTVATPNGNVLTSANNQQQVQQTMATTTRTASTKPNNVTSPIASKLQKPNGNIPTKNVVFQKEGKLYIIDPQQMKYKQQQKKQVSLLKPEISLLKQQQQQNQSVSQAPPLSRNLLAIMKPISETKHSTTAQLSINRAPPIHFGLKQQRINSINAQQLIQMKRVLFEKQFFKQEFSNMRSAVEFLLRRLKLIASKDSLVSAFPFVSYTQQEFHSLTAFKQRACEWLRAKDISHMIRNHKDLQKINQSSKEIFWSTKEIAIFARQYAYTPPIKSLPKPEEKQLNDRNDGQHFTDLVRSELKQEHNLQYNTLTDQQQIRKWIDKIWHNLEDYEHYVDEHRIIDVESISDEHKNKNKRNSKVISSFKHFPLPSLDVYLPPPPQLANQCQLVSDICKDLSIQLTYEELDTRVFHQSAQTVLAQCLHLFIEKLLRQSIALKQEQLSTSTIETICVISPHDLAKVLTINSEFDFLTNNNFGSTSLAESLMSSIKQEKS